VRERCPLGPQGLRFTDLSETPGKQLAQVAIWDSNNMQPEDLMGILCNLCFLQCLTILFLLCPYPEQRWKDTAGHCALVNTKTESHRGLFTTAPDEEIRVSKVQLAAQGNL